MWGLALASIVGMVVLHVMAGGRTPTPADAGPSILYDAPNFILVNQDGNHFGNADLRGQPWVADFIYTTCGSICPMMSMHMQSLQSQLPPQVKLVSFSVDPVHDTPAVLTDYARKYQAVSGRWFFLTGDLLVQTQVVSAMKLYFKPADATSPIEHDPHFVLVDAHGHIRGYYDSGTPAEMDKLVSDAKWLCDHESGGAN